MHFNQLFIYFQLFLSYSDIVQTGFQSPSDVSLLVWPPAGLFTPGSTFKSCLSKLSNRSLRRTRINVAILA